MKSLRIFVHSSTYEQVRVAAAKNGLPMSRWLRRVVKQALAGDAYCIQAMTPEQRRKGKMIWDVVFNLHPDYADRQRWTEQELADLLNVDIGFVRHWIEQGRREKEHRAEVDACNEAHAGHGASDCDDHCASEPLTDK